MLRVAEQEEKNGAATWTAHLRAGLLQYKETSVFFQN
jgi:hypothetical protein